MTKAEERKALEQIKAIVEALGNDSYIGMAFDGCFEIAAENIENDWGCSLKKDVEDLEDEVEYFKEQYNSMKEKMARLKEKKDNLREALEAKVSDLEQRNENQAWMIDNGTKLIREKNDKLWEAENRIEKLEMENMKLKAKLYDLMMAEQNRK